MTADRPFVSYQDKLNHVLTYIYENIDEDLSLDTLADIACMSRYHWHRVFRAMTGETLAAVVRRMRLNIAANTLIHEETPVRAIAEQVGYKNLASFSRAFKITHGVSPGEFRKQGAKITSFLNQNERVESMYPVQVMELKGFRAAGVSHVGPYRQIGRVFKDLGGILMANSLMPHVDLLFVIYHDPPESKPGAELRSHVGVSIQDEFPDNFGGLDYFDVAGGTYAVLEHKGPYANLKAAYDWFYGKWLPETGLEPKDEPPLEVYINDPKTTPSADLRTEIRLPLL